jgi:hypothetical protein
VRLYNQFLDVRSQRDLIYTLETDKKKTPHIVTFFTLPDIGRNWAYNSTFIPRAILSYLQLEAVGLKTNILTKIFYQTLIRLVIY